MIGGLKKIENKVRKRFEFFERENFSRVAGIYIPRKQRLKVYGFVRRCTSIQLRWLALRLDRGRASLLLPPPTVERFAHRGSCQGLL